MATRAWSTSRQEPQSDVPTENGDAAPLCRGPARALRLVLGASPTINRRTPCAHAAASPLPPDSDLVGDPRPAARDPEQPHSSPAEQRSACIDTLSEGRLISADLDASRCRQCLPHYPFPPSSLRNRCEQSFAGGQRVLSADDSFSRSSQKHAASSTIIAAATVVSFIVLVVFAFLLFFRITRRLRRSREAKRRKEALAAEAKAGGTYSAPPRKRGKGKNAFAEVEWEGVPVSCAVALRVAALLIFACFRRLEQRAFVDSKIRRGSIRRGASSIRTAAPSSIPSPGRCSLSAAPMGPTDADIAYGGRSPAFALHFRYRRFG